MHFGHARAGIASPSFKHGRYSLVLPRGMLQDYAAARSDPHWLSLRDELALTDARIVALIRRVEGGGDAATVLAAARQAYASYRAASNARDVQKMGQALTRLGGALAGTGAAPDLVTSETLTTLTELRKRLGEAQARMLKDLHQMLSLERVLAIMDHLSALVREHVPDPVQRRGIQEGLTRLLVAPKTDEER